MEQQLAAITLLSLLLSIAMGVILGATEMFYNPRIIWKPMDAMNSATAIGYAVLCLMPMGLELWTEYRFRKARCES